MERILSTERSEELLRMLYDHYKDSDNHDIIIEIVRYLLKLNSEEEEYRLNLVDVYRLKYKDNPKLEDFIRMSNLTQTWRNIHEAISDFEKHIAFFPGSFVHHNKWGIGCIKEATHQYLVIDFSKKRAHQMDITMAVGSLEVLPSNHFWVLKSVVPKDKLKKQILAKPIWGLKKIITSLNGADIKAIKNELTPSLLTPQEWTSWSIKARNILQNNPHFGLLLDRSDFYIFSENPINPLEKLSTAFKMEGNFISKVKLIRKALDTKIFEEAETEDILLTIVDYFISYIKTISSTQVYDEQFAHSLFICHEIIEHIPTVQHNIPIKLKDFIENITIEGAKSIIKQLKINEYKDLFFECVRLYQADITDIYLATIPYYHTTNIINELESRGDIEILQKIYIHLQNNASSFKQAFIWFTTNLYEKEWYKEITTDVKVYSELIRIANLVHKDIQNKYQVPISKRLFANIEQFIFDVPKGKLDSRINIFIREHDENKVKYVFSLINQISSIIPNRILELRDSILQSFPNFDFNDQFEFEQTGSTGFLTLLESFDKRKKILQHIHEIEVPQNSKEIEKARSYGDLKENAEYKAALEHQDNLNNRVAKLKKEIEKARIFDEKKLIC